MKIAMIGQKGVATSAGGIERHVEEVGARLSARGHEVDVFCRAHYTNERGVYRGMRIRMRPAIHSKHLDAMTHTLSSSLSLLGANYDVAHYHALGPTAMSPIARLAGVRVVSTCHGLDWKREKWGRAARAMLRAAEWPTARVPHRLITVSRTLASYFERRYGVHATAIPNGIDVPLDLAAPDEIGRRWGLTGADGQAPFVLFLSRLVPEKGAHLLVEAFKTVDTSARLVIAGGSSHSDDYVRALHASAKDDPRVLFAGEVSGRAWSELLGNACLYVLPSTLEGLPISLLEAMGHGRPCIASDIPENREIVEDEQGGEPYAKTFAAGDAGALAGALRDAFANPETMRKTGERARAMVSRRFDWEVITERIEAVYREAAGAR